jgi:hypothetical protein
MKKTAKITSNRITVRLCRKTYNALIDLYLPSTNERAAIATVNARLRTLMVKYVTNSRFCKEISVRVCRDPVEGPKCSAESICVLLDREWYVEWKSQLAIGMVSSVLLAITRWELERLNRMQETKLVDSHVDYLDAA